MDSDAGELMRYRKQLGAEQIQIFTDLKKKHSSHAISADISLTDTLHAAEFFLSDGGIITGVKTGSSVNERELSEVYDQSNLPVLVGSGVTPEGLAQIFDHADAFIVGSFFKHAGDWVNSPDPERVKRLVEAREKLLS